MSCCSGRLTQAGLVTSCCLFWCKLGKPPLNAQIRQVEFQRLRESWAPDLIFQDETFNPLLPSVPGLESIADRLRKWEAGDERQLHSLMKRVLQRWVAQPGICAPRPSNFNRQKHWREMPHDLTQIHGTSEGADSACSCYGLATAV